MIDDINLALQTYAEKLPKECATLKADATAWKVADAQEYASCYQALRPLCDKLVETWMNGRWIAELHLKDNSLINGTTLIKLMQRRPGSDDAPGLDHVDFICDDIATFEKRLQAQVDLKWSWETNDVVDDYRWISLWFAGTEAKVKDQSVVEIIIKDFQALKH